MKNRINIKQLLLVILINGNIIFNINILLAQNQKKYHFNDKIKISGTCFNVSKNDLINYEFVYTKKDKFLFLVQWDNQQYYSINNKFKVDKNKYGKVKTITIYRFYKMNSEYDFVRVFSFQHFKNFKINIKDNFVLLELIFKEKRLNFEVNIILCTFSKGFNNYYNQFFRNYNNMY